MPFINGDTQKKLDFMPFFLYNRQGIIELAEEGQEAADKKAALRIIKKTGVK